MSLILISLVFNKHGIGHAVNKHHGPGISPIGNTFGQNARTPRPWYFSHWEHVWTECPHEYESRCYKRRYETDKQRHWKCEVRSVVLATFAPNVTSHGIARTRIVRNWDFDKEKQDQLRKAYDLINRLKALVDVLIAC